MKSLGLYLHIPFCRSKCAYCDFYSVPGREGEMDAYMTALCADLKRWGSRAGGYRADTVYLGGGTPSWFGAERVSAALAAVRNAFTLTEDCEITLEANPDSVSPSLLAGLREAGVNRLSLGVQSAGEGELKTAGRPHSFAQAAEAVKLAREAGFTNLSLDLIYGLPGQTMESWQNSVEAVLALRPEHLSLYGLKVEEGTPFYRRREELDFPDEDFQADCYLWACARLREAGFAHYEISNFACPGFESRHNLKYWTLGEYLGFGPAAHSDFQGRRFGNARDLPGYLAGRCPRSEDAAITPEARREEYVMLGLRTSRGIAEGEYPGDFAPLEEKLRFFARHGLSEKQNGRWKLTERGWLVSNSILVELL